MKPCPHKPNRNQCWICMPCLSDDKVGELHAIASRLEWVTSRSQREPHADSWKTEVNGLIRKLVRFTA